MGPSGTHIDEKRYKCDRCNRGFSRRYRFKKHKCVNEEESDEEESDEEESESDNEVGEEDESSEDNEDSEEDEEEGSDDDEGSVGTSTSSKRRNLGHSLQLGFY